MAHLPYRELPLADPGEADRRSPARYLAWLARRQWRTLALASLFGVTWMLSQALLWSAVGAALDHGIIARSTPRLLEWVAVVVALGVVQAISGAMRHQLAVTNWMWAAYRTVQLIGRHATLATTALVDEIPAGDVVNTVASDAMRIGGAFDVLPRFLGALVAWAVVATILLSTSLQLGLVVLIGVPVLASLTTPLMRPLHAAQAAQREVAGRLAALAADTVAGLRILRGVGGEEVFLEVYRTQSERVRLAGNRVATPQAGLESGQVLLPALLTALVTLLGARDVLAGTLAPGQLVAFFGYATFLTTPLRTVIEYSIATTRAYVGAGRVLRILAVAPPVAATVDPQPWPARVARYEDRVSGLRLNVPGLYALVTETPAEASALADRLGRFVDDPDVSVDGVALGSFDLDEVRAHVLVSEIEPRLFSGALRDELAPHGARDDDALDDALAAASARDVVEGLPEGLDTWVSERGRSFSGGQRQRLTLARALLADPDLLILVEPTSGVDTHTEGRIAATLGAARAGRTTLIATTSPLMLAAVDRVAVVVDSVVVAEGTHDELVRSSPRYRAIVLREEEP
ncbi:MAG: ABC transporter transmembrane domain-containing protein [Acidimicrobiales bacterium]